MREARTGPIVVQIVHRAVDRAAPDKTICPYWTVGDNRIPNRASPQSIPKAAAVVSLVADECAAGDGHGGRIVNTPTNVIGLIVSKGTVDDTATKAVYLDGLLMLCFSAKTEPWRGVLICTDHKHHAALIAEFPVLVPHPVLPKWLYLPESADNFERTAERLVALARRRDPRLGVVPQPKKRKQSGGLPRK